MIARHCSVYLDLSLVPTTILWGGYFYYPPSTKGETEVQSWEIPCPKLCTWDLDPDTRGSSTDVFVERPQARSDRPLCSPPSPAQEQGGPTGGHCRLGGCARGPMCLLRGPPTRPDLLVLIPKRTGQRDRIARAHVRHSHGHQPLYLGAHEPSRWCQDHLQSGA